MAHLLHRFCPSTSLTWLILLKVRKSHLAVMLDKMLLLLALFSLCFHTRSLTGCRNPVFPFPFLTSMFSFQSQLAASLRSSDMSQVGDLESWIFFSVGFLAPEGKKGKGVTLVPSNCQSSVQKCSKGGATHTGPQQLGATIVTVMAKAILS